MYEMDDWGELTPSEQKLALAKMRARQRDVARSIKRRVSELAAFVKHDPGAVLQINVRTFREQGSIDRCVFEIDLDAERFDAFMNAMQPPNV